MKIVISGSTYQTKKNACVRNVVEQLLAMGVEVCMEVEYAHFLRDTLLLDLSRISLLGKDAPLEADYVISMGGDGTFLSSAAMVGDAGIPILGINTGHLGFLADVSPEDVGEALESVVAGKGFVEQHSLLAVECDGALLSASPYALNEVAVLKHDDSSLIEVETFVDDALLNVYLSDGLIVSTPTGSTGYSLSVGGPIIEPSSNSFCISPVASHSLNTRPVVLRDDAVIRLKVRSRSHRFLIAIDGRSESLSADATLTLRRAPFTIGVVKVKHRHFFDTLRDKMMWGADQRR